MHKTGRKTGYYQNFDNKKFFIPYPLPPHDPPLQLDDEMIALIGDTMLELGKLNGIVQKVPDMKRFLKAYVYKEAVLSSSIEGIHTTLLNVFMQPFLTTKPDKDTQLVMNYTKALEKAIRLMKKDGLPVSSRVILSAHKELMEGEGDNADPGHYRRLNVQVGDLITAPHQEVRQLMAELESYINSEDAHLPLIKAGLAHVQFETIHPFLDGNGRIGRLLIVLILIEGGLLAQPLLYPSYYFKKNRWEYYQKLNHIQMQGDFEGWIKFYLTAIKMSCIDAYRRAQDIDLLAHTLLDRLTHKQKRGFETRKKVLSILFLFPVIGIPQLSLEADISYNTAHQIIDEFLKYKILVPENERKRGKLFKFQQYLDILEREYS